MADFTLTLTTPRNKQARLVQAAAVGGVVLNLGELEMLDLSVVSDITTSNAVSVVRTLVLHPGTRFAEQIPTQDAQLATINGLFGEVEGMTCACTVTPVTTV